MSEKIETHFAKNEPSRIEMLRAAWESRPKNYSERIQARQSALLDAIKSRAGQIAEKLGVKLPAKVPGPEDSPQAAILLRYSKDLGLPLLGDDDLRLLAEVHDAITALTQKQNDVMPSHENLDSFLEFAQNEAVESKSPTAVLNRGEAFTALLDRTKILERKCLNEVSRLLPVWPRLAESIRGIVAKAKEREVQRAAESAVESLSPPVVTPTLQTLDNIGASLDRWIADASFPFAFKNVYPFRHHFGGLLLPLIAEARKLPKEKAGK